MGCIAPRMFAGHGPDASGSCPYENQDRARGPVSHAFVSKHLTAISPNGICRAALRSSG